MNKNERILVIAPHPDDETLGLGGSIAKYRSFGSEIFILIVSGHLPPLYSKKDYLTTEKEAKRAFQILGVNNFKFLKVPATKVNELAVAELNFMIESIIKDFEPSIVFCPYPDRHIDHKIIFESSLVVSRPIGIGRKIKLLCAYETLSETHWNAPHIEPNFIPNCVFDISNFINIKLEALKSYKSQISASDGPRSLRAIEALAKFRGSQSGFDYGEGFHIIRMTD